MENRIPPNEKEIEQSVLASIFNFPDYQEEAAAQLDPGCFYFTSHKIIFQKFKELKKNGQIVGINHIFAELNDEEKKQVKATLLSKLVDNLDIPLPANFKHYASILKDRKARQCIIEYLNAIQKRVYKRDDDLSKVQEFANAIIDVISSNFHTDNNCKIASGIMKVDNFMEMKLAEKRTFLDPWITEQSITLISGWRGVGKSWLALSIIDSISKGAKFGPWETEISVPCLYLDAEMAAQDMQYRVMELNMGDGCKSPVFIYSDAYSSQLGIPKANMLNDKWRISMKQFFLSNNIKLWVADNIGSLAPGINENIKEDYDPINQWLLDLRFSGISTILLHHVGK